MNRHLNQRDQSYNTGDMLAKSVFDYLLKQKELSIDLAKSLVKYAIQSENIILQLKLGLVDSEKNINDGDKHIKDYIILDLGKYK